MRLRYSSKDTIMFVNVIIYCLLDVIIPKEIFQRIYVLPQICKTNNV